MLRIWHNLDGSAYYMKLTRQFNGTFSRLFNTEYKQLISDLRLCKKDGKKPSYNEAITLAERLSCYQQKCREYSEAEAPIKVFLGAAYKGIETEWDYITGQLSTLESMFSNDMSFGTLGSYSDFVAEKNFFADYFNYVHKAKQHRAHACNNLVRLPFEKRSKRSEEKTC